MKVFFLMMLMSVFHFIFFSNPLSLVMSFFFALISVSAIIASMNMMLGMILFLVYVGGTMVIVLYCVMLTPLHEISLRYNSIFPIFFAYAYNQIFFTVYNPGYASSISEIYFHPEIIYLIGSILFLVMLAVVEVVDFLKSCLTVWPKKLKFLSFNG